MLAISSLSNHLRLRKEVGYPTIFSASDTALFQSWRGLTAGLLNKAGDVEK
jgi:hypothetical protein